MPAHSRRRNRYQPEVNSDSSTETSLQQNRIQSIASHRSTGIPTVIPRASSKTSLNSSTCSRRHERNVDPATLLRSSSSSRCSRVWASTLTKGNHHEKRSSGIRLLSLLFD